MTPPLSRPARTPSRGSARAGCGGPRPGSPRGSPSRGRRGRRASSRVSVPKRCQRSSGSAPVRSSRSRPPRFACLSVSDGHVSEDEPAVADLERRAARAVVEQLVGVEVGHQRRVSPRARRGRSSPPIPRRPSRRTRRGRSARRAPGGGPRGGTAACSKHTGSDRPCRHARSPEHDWCGRVSLRAHHPTTRGPPDDRHSSFQDPNPEPHDRRHDGAPRPRSPPSTGACSRSWSWRRAACSTATSRSPRSGSRTSSSRTASAATSTRSPGRRTSRG